MIRVAHGLRRRRVDEWKLLDRAEPERLEPQQHAGEPGAQDLGLRELGPLGEVLLRIQPHADAGREPAAAARALHGVRARDRLDRQALHAMPRAVAAHAREPRVDHVADPRHGQRRLGDVRREHDPRRLARREDLALARAREPRIERQELVALRSVARERALRVADPALAGQEHELVADRPLAALGRELVRGRGHGRREVLVLVDGPVADLDREAPALDEHDRRVAEVAREALGIDRRRRDDHLEIGPLALEPLQVAENEVDVEAALVRLVDDQRVVLREPAVAADLVEQDAVGHHLDQRAGARLIGEPHLEADRVAELHLELLGEPRGDRLRRDPARLRVADHPRDAAAGLEADLRQLRRLAAAGVAADDDHAMPSRAPRGSPRARR